MANSMNVFVIGIENEGYYCEENACVVGDIIKASFYESKEEALKKSEHLYNVYIRKLRLTNIGVV